MIRRAPFSRELVVLGRWRVPYAPAFGWRVWLRTRGARTRPQTGTTSYCDAMQEVRDQLFTYQYGSTPDVISGDTAYTHKTGAGIDAATAQRQHDEWQRQLAKTARALVGRDDRHVYWQRVEYQPERVVYTCCDEPEASSVHLSEEDD